MSTRPLLCLKSAGMSMFPALSLRQRISASQECTVSASWLIWRCASVSLFVGDRHLLAYCRDEAICDGTCGVVEVVADLYVEDGLS